MFDQQGTHAVSRRTFLKLTGGAALGAAVVSACAPVASTTTPQGQSTDAGGASTAHEAVALRFSTIGWGGWLSEPWMEMLNRFNEEDADVQASFEDIAEGYEKVMAQAAGNVAADVYLFENKYMYSYASRNFFLPLDDMVAGSEIVTKDAYYEADWNESFWRGTQYLAPFDNSPAMIWYNTDLFDAAGVAYPPSTFDDPDWQWEDFLSMAQQLTQGEGAEKVFGWVGERTWYYALNWIWSNGGDVLNPAKTECVIDMPETVEALQWAADLTQKHQVQPVADQIIEGGTSAMFFGQRAAMAQKGTWWAIDLKAQEGLNWNVAPQPAGRAGAYVRNPLDAYGIWQGTQHPEEAWQLIESLSTPDSLAIIVRAGLSVSRKETMEQVFLTQEPQHVNWQLFLDALQSHTRRHPDTAIYPEMHNLLQPAWEALLDGASSAEAMVAEVKDPINQLLAECLEEGNCVAETA
jgi:multiple sugar transport system substrate-binding protein